MGAPVLRGLAAIPSVRRLIDLALDEDLGRGDVTSQVTVGSNGPVILAEMNVRVPIVVFGVDIAAAPDADWRAAIDAVGEPFAVDFHAITALGLPSSLSCGYAVVQPVAY